MKFKGLGAFIRRYFFNPEWRCAACGKEIFGGGYFCAECLAKLPFISGYICGHCGRPVPAPAEYCEACKNRITELDCGRSVFRYEYPVSGLILRFKYGGQKYLGDMFAGEHGIHATRDDFFGLCGEKRYNVVFPAVRAVPAEQLDEFSQLPCHLSQRPRAAGFRSPPAALKSRAR